MAGAFKFLGLWLFRLWLAVLALPLALAALVLQVFESVAGHGRQPFTARLGDRLVSGRAPMVPLLVGTFLDHFQGDADGPGWSREQVPRLWETCLSLSAQMGLSPPDAIHLSLEPQTCMAWSSRTGQQPLRRHIALSLLDLRLLSVDEARAVIAHELVHIGRDHHPRDVQEEHLAAFMLQAIYVLPFPLTLPVHLASELFRLGRKLGSHHFEQQADQWAASAVGGNHAARALQRICLQGPVLGRVFGLVLERARAGPRAPARLGEAAMRIFRTYDFAQMRKLAFDVNQVPGEEHPALPDRVAAARRRPEQSSTNPQPFLDAFPELVKAEELLTASYFPETPTHARSDGSQLRRKALAARLTRR